MNDTGGIVSRVWGFCRTLRMMARATVIIMTISCRRPWAALPQIDFADDRDGCLFTKKVHRKTAEELELVNLSSSGLKLDITSGMVMNACREKPSVTIPELISGENTAESLPLNIRPEKESTPKSSPQRRKEHRRKTTK
jgi:hypothetical protein